ncbi:hypothetical protein LFYK43_12440 [Ligilactobacillus salitolerans]|uniref:Uncharacterized protein n=1 Tax=Ligilactobacillus salitolerans TaxID=1808352 RepID=A0A401ITF9_9LACO|nr:hypothetical protein [Ligilactobacillus salitolerans]GBG94785.1 hypothetical protein LFYK43_12440 [Ligilactobacillus salitolerans]
MIDNILDAVNMKIKKWQSFVINVLALLSAILFYFVAITFTGIRPLAKWGCAACFLVVDVGSREVLLSYRKRHDLPIEYDEEENQEDK